MVRVYSKHPGRPPDLQRPFTLPRGSTVADLARLIHRDLPETMKSARLWGHGRFEGQHVHRTEVLADRDVVEIHVRDRSAGHPPSPEASVDLCHCLGLTPC